MNAREGRIPESPGASQGSKRKRSSGTVSGRADACVEFVLNRTSYKSLNIFVAKKKRTAPDGAWCPSKGQMVRDMKKIFGDDWALRRGGGGTGPGGGMKNALNAEGLDIPDNSEMLLEPHSRPTTLSIRMERAIIRDLREFEDRFGTGIITPVLIESVCRIHVLKQIPDVRTEYDVIEKWNSSFVQNALNVVLRQLQSIETKSWMYRFLERNKTKIRRKVRRRALERHKAAKHQVELVMAHFRNMYHAEALAQIQRKCATTGDIVAGFSRFENIIQECGSHHSSERDSLIDVRNNVLYVTSLNEPLEHVSAHFRFALDETPIVPDSPLLKTYTTGNRIPLCQGRASIWTLLPVLCANGTVVSTLLLQKSLSLSVDAAKFSAQHDLCVAATENAQQTDTMWLEFAKDWLPRCGTSFVTRVMLLEGSYNLLHNMDFTSLLSQATQA